MQQGLIAKITAVLRHVPLVRNLARQKFIAHFVIGLIKSRNVRFGAVARHLNGAGKPAPDATRTQDFFRAGALDYLVLARLLVSLLPVQGKGRVCLDRTAGDFGQCQGNTLLVTVGRGAFQVPLCWELPDNRSGNANAAQRVAVLHGCRAAPGRARSGVVRGPGRRPAHARRPQSTRLPGHQFGPQRLEYPAANYPPSCRYPAQTGPIGRSRIRLVGTTTHEPSNACENSRVE